MVLEVAARDGQRVDFRWTQQLRLVSDTAPGGLSYKYVAEAIPLLISPR